MKFPYEWKEFLAYQESLVGRKLTTPERDLLGGWLPYINEAAAETPEDFAADMDFLDRKIQSAAGDPGRVNRLKFVKFWMGQARKEIKTA